MQETTQTMNEQGKDIWDMSEDEARAYINGQDEQPDEVDTTDTIEEVKSPLDGEGESADEKQDEPTEVKETTPPVNKWGGLSKKPVWNGQEVDIDDEDTALRLIQQGIDYTFKMQQLREYKNKLAKIDGIDDDELEILLRARQGDKEALATLIKDKQVDPFELEGIAPIQRKEVAQQSSIAPEVMEYENIVKTSDPATYGKMANLIQFLPTPVKQAFAQNSELFAGFYSDVRDGTFEKVLPVVTRKIVSSDPMTQYRLQNDPAAFLSAYAEAVTEINKAAQPQPAVAPKQKVAVQKGRNSARVEQVKKDIWDMSEDEFKQIYGKLPVNFR